MGCSWIYSFYGYFIHMLVILQPIATHEIAPDSYLNPLEPLLYLAGSTVFYKMAYA